MNKKIIMAIFFSIILVSPVLSLTAKTTTQTTQTQIIRITNIAPKPEKRINPLNAYAGMQHWMTTLRLYDKNLNKIEDKLEFVLQSYKKDIEVVVSAAYGNLEAAMKTFEEYGGKILKTYPATASFRGIIPAEKISVLASETTIGWIQSVHKDYTPYLRVSIPQQRIGTLDSKAVPPSSYPEIEWTPWAKNIYGDPNTAIAVVDTGLDDSHPEIGPYGGPSSGTWETYKTITGSVSGTGTSGSHYNNPSSTAWSEHQVYLEAGVQYYISLDWGTTADLDMYLYKPGTAPSQDGSGSDYAARAYTTNKPETISITPSVSGYWVIAVDHYSATTSSTTYQITIKKYVQGSSGGIDWNAKIIYWKDFTSDGRAEPADGNGHGSHCAGIASAKGVASDPYGAYAHRGVAPEAKLVGLAIFKMDGSFDADVYEVIQWLIDNAATYHIIVASNSWGGGDDAQLNELMNQLVQHGVVAVVAAGNSGYGANIGSPGSAELAITVGAVNDLNEMAEYSTSGDTSTGATIKPDVTANGGSGWYANHAANNDDENGDGYKGKIGSVDSNDAQNTPGDNNYWDIPGTSMATPHVSGIAALVIDAMGGWSSWDYSAQKALLVKMIILMTAVEFTRAESPNKVPAPTLDRGGKDRIEGYGRVNADAAIMAVLNQLQVGGTYTYYLGSTSSSAQWYAPRAWAGNIYLEAGQEYTFTLDVPNGADFDIYIYRGYPNEYGEPVIVAKGINSQLGGDEIVTFQPTESGKYYVVVKWIDRSLDGVPDTQNAGQFTLTIQAGSSSSGGEEGGSSGGEEGGGSSNVYTPPTTITGTVSGDGTSGAHFNNPSSTAWSEFLVHLESGTQYRFTLNWDSSSDLDMYLYRPGTAPSQDGGGDDYVVRAYTTNKPETFEVTADVTGDWVVAVDHYSGSGSASFQISVEVLSSSGGDSGGSSGGGGTFPLTLTGSVSGDGSTGPHYNNPSSSAWSYHTVNLDSGVTYRITLSWDSSSDLDLYVYKPSAQYWSEYYKRAYTTNKPEVLEFTADESGEWIIAVDHYSSSGSASYEIRIEIITTSSVSTLSETYDKNVVYQKVDTDGDGLSDALERSFPLADPKNPLLPAVIPPILLIVIVAAVVLIRRRKYS